MLACSCASLDSNSCARSIQRLSTSVRCRLSAVSDITRVASIAALRTGGTASKRCLGCPRLAASLAKSRGSQATPTVMRIFVSGPPGDVLPRSSADTTAKETHMTTAAVRARKTSRLGRRPNTQLSSTCHLPTARSHVEQTRQRCAAPG